MLSTRFVRFVAAAAEKQAKNFMRKTVPGVGRMIVTIGNKGGVGRSTVTVNTAVALAKQGYKVGIFDGDVYSPSIPRLLGATNKLIVPNKEQIYSPVKSFGIQYASVGNVVDAHDALFWRAPFIGSVLGDFLLKAYWKDLDYLLVDTPSGTGDIQLALMTLFKPDGAIVVTTPDTLAYNETLRSIDMLKTMPLSVLGLVENMSSMNCSKCNKEIQLFKGDAGKRLCERFKLDNMGSIPLASEIADASDKGVPVYTTTKNEKIKNVYEKIAKTIVEKLPKKTPDTPAQEVKEQPPEPATL